MCFPGALWVLTVARFGLRVMWGIRGPTLMCTAFVEEAPRDVCIHCPWCVPECQDQEKHPDEEFGRCRGEPACFGCE